MTREHPRRGALAVAVTAAALPALSAMRPAGTDGDLLSDVARLHALQDRIDALIDDRDRRLATVPERFQNLEDLDPRGITTIKHPKSWGHLYAQAVAYEPVYVAAGLGEVADRVNELFDEEDKIMDPLMTASPTTVRGKAALVGVLHRDRNAALLRDLDNDDWDAKLASKVRDLLASLDEGGVS